MTQQNLVLGTAFGYGVPQVRVFVESLRRHYDGEVQLLVNARSAEELSPYLKQRDIIPRIFEAPSFMASDVQVARYAGYLEILEERKERYDRVLLTDVGDVFFQAHPFTGLPEGALLFFMEDHRIVIGRCASNSLWVRELYGKAVLKLLADKPISCSGTTIGTQAAIAHYLELILAHADPERMAPLHGGRGHDQGIHNFLLHTGEVEARPVPNGDFVFTMARVPAGEFVVAADGIKTLTGRLCPIVHQYNYHAGLAPVVEEAILRQSDTPKKTV